VQVMRIGPYATEPATIERMREFMKENRYRDCVGLGGKHHEIYVGDPRKADPAFDKLPNWPPDGNNEIYVMNADASRQTRLTDNLADDGNPSLLQP